MSDQSDLQEKLAAKIKNYRKGEIPAPDADHVKKWINQFPVGTRRIILSEMIHIFGKTYVTETNAKQFLSMVINNEKFSGTDPKAFWQTVKFLNIQTAGNSQHELMAMFDAALQKECDGLRMKDCGKTPSLFVYLDDAIFSGGRVKSDLVRWIEQDAPPKADIAVIAMGIHSLGEYFAKTDIEKAAKQAKKEVNVKWWRSVSIEDRKTYMASSDVLRPTKIPDEAKAYVKSLGQEPILRTPGGKGKLELFSSDEARIVVEQEFLKIGVHIRTICPNLNQFMRPLGCTTLKTTGFGSMFVTYRNCANNTPLALWAGDPWYPLLPRKTN